MDIKEVHDDILPVSFAAYHLRDFDLKARLLEPLENRFSAKVLRM